MTAPLLSICVPTYNRAALLRLGLKNLQEVCAKSASYLEVVVSDNSSSDETPSVIAEFANCPFMRFHRHPVNIGGHGNFLETVRTQARGEFCWMVGDDDYVLPGEIERILKMLQAQSDIDLFVVNHAVISIEERNHVIEHGSTSEFPPISSWMAREAHSARYPNLAPVIALGGGDFRFLTHISAQIFRRKVWMENSLDRSSFHPDRPYTTLTDTYPHLMILLEAGTHRPVWYEGQPVIAVGIGSQEWANANWLFVVLRSEELFTQYSRMGVPPSYLRQLRRKWMKLWLGSLRQLLQRTGPFATPPELLHEFLRVSLRSPFLLASCFIRQVGIEVIRQFRRRLNPEHSPA